MGGTPVFVGTRVPVQSLFVYLEAGDSLEEFLEAFPTVSREQAVAALITIGTVPTKVREAIRMIEDDGWVQVKATSGTSHRQYKHPTKPGRVTISGKMSDDLAPGTFNSILKQAGLK